MLLSGGKDGQLITWKRKKGKVFKSEEYNLSNFAIYASGIRSIDCNDDGVLLIGTRGSEIYEMASAE